MGHMGQAHQVFKTWEQTKIMIMAWGHWAHGCRESCCCVCSRL